jgi:hypothetical protein
LCLPPSYTWTLKGRAHQHRVRSRWGSAGRIDLIVGTLRSEGEAQRLGHSLIEGPCRSGEVKHYLDALAEQEAQREGKPCVVVLDNASFHTAGMIREREAPWEARGL